MKDELYLRLYEKRESLKKNLENGRVPTVCKDDALREMARLLPKSHEELICITGLGKTFAEKYGEDFLPILREFHAKSLKTSLLCPEVKSTLKNLENRLVNINKRNRLLFMPRLTASTGLDLLKPDTNAVNKNFNTRLGEFIRRFESGKRFAVCDSSSNDYETDRFKKITSLLREATRVLRESGENDLYIAYPFVAGKIAGEDFNVRAPLSLFPVEVIKEGETYCIKMDTSRDVLYNSSLVLSNFKFNNINKALPDCAVEEVEFFKFLERTVEFYAQNDLTIKNDNSGLKSFSEYTVSTFPRFKGGEFILQEHIVLGKFSMYSSSLQRDFKNIMESEKINGLLNNLLQRYEDIDMYSESEDLGERPTNSPYNESNLNYINDLNISQEYAIINININDKLVIQGPPGTGKSQTITSMIADFVAKGKNVLMVSQKKAALDVIYSRLGALNKYSILINDVKDKDSFYNQLAAVFGLKEPVPFNEREFASASEAIDADLTRLEAIADKLYYSDMYGTEMYRIYEEDLKSELSHSDISRIKVYERNLPSALYDVGYPAAKKYAEMFSNPEILSFCTKYYELTEQFGWLAEMKELDNFAQPKALKSADSIIEAFCAYKALPALKRLFSNGKIQKPVKAFVKQYFGWEKAHKVLAKSFAADPVELYNGLKNNMEFYRLKARFDKLDEKEKLYFGSAYNVGKETGDLAEAMRQTKDFIGYYYINEFETDNKEIVIALDNYSLTVKHIVKLISDKKELTKSRLKNSLFAANSSNIQSSKRFGDMQRIIESKRRWSVDRYISKFSFELFKGIKIWLLTPEVVSDILPLENGLFDLLIFDEASQIYIEKGVPSIARAKKVVITGDHKQLRPSSLGMGRIGYDEDEEEMNAALEEESLLDLARFKFPEVVLDYHYRSKYEELIAFSNYAFYKGRLNVSPNIEEVFQPIKVHYVENGSWDERKNLEEAKVVVNLISDYLLRGNGRDTLGVITFNSSQRDLIMDMLDEMCIKNPAFAAKYIAESNRKMNGEDIGLFVKNIENVQGDERDRIIFSLAYAKNDAGKIVRNFGWLNQAGGENRLNVAISRAKKHIDIVTSIYPEELKVADLTNEGPRILKKYLEYAYFVSGGDKESAKQVLRSLSSATTATNDSVDDFAFIVYGALIGAGFNAELNVGLGSYKIDIALKNDDGKYILGIECDSSLYSKRTSARERDIHRKLYLENRGWKIHRVWSSRWWRNSRAEIEKIRGMLQK